MKRLFYELRILIAEKTLNLALFVAPDGDFKVLMAKYLRGYYKEAMALLLEKMKK